MRLQVLEAGRGERGCNPKITAKNNDICIANHLNRQQSISAANFDQDASPLEDVRRSLCPSQLSARKLRNIESRSMCVLKG